MERHTLGHLASMDCGFVLGSILDLPWVRQYITEQTTDGCGYELVFGVALDLFWGGMELGVAAFGVD